MEEQKDYFEQEQASAPIAEPPLAEGADRDGVAAAQTSAPDAAAQPAVSGEPMPEYMAPASDMTYLASTAPFAGEAPWSFDQKPPRKKTGIGTFFAIFGGVFGLCIALLIATLFLGEGGFQIIKTFSSLISCCCLL